VSARAEVQRPRSSARTAAVVTATLALVSAAWVVAAHQMRGMDMGASTDLGSPPFFLAAWLSMMTAMMLPGALPALVRRARTGSVFAAPRFAGSYLAVWTAVGLVAYTVDRPHGTALAGALTVAAGVYELTPLKRRCRLRCREDVESGSRFGLACLGSSIGLMIVLLAVGVMSLLWMGIVAVLVVAQKLLPPRPLLDIPVALALVGIGIAIAAATSSIPGIT